MSQFNFFIVILPLLGRYNYRLVEEKIFLWAEVMKTLDLRLRWINVC
jgi:hypothetical protein